MGELLAVQAPAEADMVMGVPESGVPAAEGFARASGIPYGQGLVKNRYIGRSFIAPDQQERADAVRRKLNPLTDAIAGKRLVVVDDSIVRGTTQRSVIRMLREAGAAEVHLRISSPPWRWPCFYGIDTPSLRGAAGDRPQRRGDGARSSARTRWPTSASRTSRRPSAPTAGSATPASPATTRRRSPAVARAGHARPARAGGGHGPPGRAARGLTGVGQGGATYAGAGVDIAAGDAAVERLRSMVAGIGGFGGQFPLDIGRYTSPVLVASTDGVGTKLVVARASGRYDTVGIDLVAMCVDDLVCVGAEPLFMLDYIATGKVDPDQVATVVAGVHEGCRQAGCALIGGETAEHAGVMARRRARPGRLRRRRGRAGHPARARAGAGGRRRRRPALAGPALQRLHAGPPRAARAGRPRPRGPGLGGRRPQRGRRAAAPVGDLHAGRPGRRAPPCGDALHACAHITGGGIVGNLPRVLPEGLGAVWTASAWEEPRVFAEIQRLGAVEPRTRWTGCSTAASGWRWCVDAGGGGRGAGRAGARPGSRSRVIGDGRRRRAPACASRERGTAPFAELRAPPAGALGARRGTSRSSRVARAAGSSTPSRRSAGPRPCCSWPTPCSR